jgi:hypothetical protein
MNELTRALLALTTTIKEADRRQQDYCDLASNLAALLESLKKHVEESRTTPISNCVVNIIK